MVVPRMVLGDFRSVSKVRKTRVIVYGLLSEWELDTPPARSREDTYVDLQALVLCLPRVPLQNSSKKNTRTSVGLTMYILEENLARQSVSSL